MQLFFYQQPRVANFVNVFYSLKIKVHTFLYFCHKIIWVNALPYTNTVTTTENVEKFGNV